MKLRHAVALALIVSAVGCYKHGGWELASPPSPTDFYPFHEYDAQKKRFLDPSWTQPSWENEGGPYPSEAVCQADRAQRIEFWKRRLATEDISAPSDIGTKSTWFNYELDILSRSRCFPFKGYWVVPIH